MATCANCGTIYSEERTRCPSCGSPYEKTYDNSYNQDYGYEGDYVVANIYRGSSRAEENTDTYDEYDEYIDKQDYSPPQRKYSPADEPAYIYSTPRDRFVMSISSFLVSILLMSIPIIGFLIQIIWAVGGAKNQNKRNLARAYLILTVISTLLFTAATIVLYGILEPYINEFMTLIEIM